MIWRMKTGHPRIDPIRSGDFFWCHAKFGDGEKGERAWGQILKGKEVKNHGEAGKKSLAG